jgi:hypothetical protein
MRNETEYLNNMTGTNSQISCVIRMIKFKLKKKKSKKQQQQQKTTHKH